MSEWQGSIWRKAVLLILATHLHQIDAVRRHVVIDSAEPEEIKLQEVNVTRGNFKSDDPLEVVRRAGVPLSPSRVHAGSAAAAAATVHVNNDGSSKRRWHKCDYITIACGTLVAFVFAMACAYKNMTDLAGNLLALGVMLAISICYMLAVGEFRGQDDGEAWFTGYVLESALSLDDLFTFHLCFAFFAVPSELANFALTVGLFGAIFSRTLLILCFSELHKVSYVFNVFVGCLLITGAIVTEVSDPDEEVKDLHAVRFFKAVLGNRLQEHYEGAPVKFSWEKGLQCNVLFLVLGLLVSLDAFSAVDIAGSKTREIGDLYINISSSLMVVFTLRPLFFIIRHMATHFEIAKHGIAAILVFLGVEMIVMKWFPVSLKWLAIIILSILCLCAIITVLRGGSHAKKSSSNDVSQDSQCAQINQQG